MSRKQWASPHTESVCGEPQMKQPVECSCTVCYSSSGSLISQPNFLSFSTATCGSVGLLCFIALHSIILCSYCIFYKLKVYDNPVLSKSISTIFSTFVHFVTLCHILVNLAIFQTFYYSFICYMWSLIFGVTIATVLGHHKPHPH